MNLIHDDINEVARAILRQIIRGCGDWQVFVRRSGAVAMTKMGSVDERRSFPVETLVGTYNRRASHADIRSDLAARLEELDRRIAA